MPIDQSPLQRPTPPRGDLLRPPDEARPDDALGMALRKMFDAVLKEDIPATLLTLLDEIDERAVPEDGEDKDMGENKSA
jgi:hypothetical protein